MSLSFDHILLIGFGGPESPENVMPFLRRVTEGKRVPEERLLLVAHHYELIGGVSPYNAWAQKLESDIRANNKLDVPIFLGYRNTAPFLEDQVLKIHQQGLKKGLGIILAPFRSTSSCRRYKENIYDALHAHGIVDLEYRYTSPWYRHPTYIELLCEIIQKYFEKIPKDQRDETDILFSCHSIPVMADKACSSCIYSAEYETTCRLVSERMGFKKWKHVYQSRSGNPAQPWLSPDILDAIKESKTNEKKAVFVIPMGFLSDNAEVLYDLDIEAQALAKNLELHFFRAPAPGNHPKLAQFFLQLIKEAASQNTNSRACKI